MKKIKIIPTKEETPFKITIDSAKKHVPEWYKQSSQKIKGLENYSLIPDFPTASTSTYKKCSPFLDALTNGYIFYLSQDIEVIRRDNGSPYILWRGAGIDPISWHDNVQWEGLKRPENSYDYLYKWENSFVIKCLYWLSIHFIIVLAFPEITNRLFELCDPPFNTFVFPKEFTRLHISKFNFSTSMNNFTRY